MVQAFSVAPNLVDDILTNPADMAICNRLTNNTDLRLDTREHPDGMPNSIDTCPNFSHCVTCFAQ